MMKEYSVKEFVSEINGLAKRFKTGIRYGRSTVILNFRDNNGDVIYAYKVSKDFFERKLANLNQKK